LTPLLESDNQVMMKRLVLLSAAAVAMLVLSACSLAQSAIQIPARTAQSLGRSIGVNIEHTDSLSGHQEFEKFE
jgi:hypothetical protein